MNKRGMAAESGTAAAATVIFIIGLLIVVYIILLPEDAREDVLKGEEIDFGDFDDFDDDDDDERDDRDKVLLLRHPGTLVPVGIDDVEKSFASVNLFDTSQKQNKKLADRLVISRSLFSNKFEELDFRIDDLENLESLSLFFNIKSVRGSVEIELNGRTVFSGSLDSGDIPIELPVVNLRGRNRLKISGSKVGVALLSTNRVELRDLELIMDFNLENKRELRTFEVSRAEAVDDAEMEFFVNCLEVGPDQGVLKVFLNRRMVFFGRVVCDASQNKFDISEDLFVDGTNRFTFEVDQGNYIIEEIELIYDFDEGFNPLYFFTVDEEDFEDIVDDDDDVKLILSVDRVRGRDRRSDEVTDRKRADIRINDKTIFMDINGKRFEKDITDFVREGENFVKIFAKNEFDLVQLEVRLERD